MFFSAWFIYRTHCRRRNYRLAPDGARITSWSINTLLYCNNVVVAVAHGGVVTPAWPRSRRWWLWRSGLSSNKHDTRNSPVADKPRDTFVQMQWRGQLPKTRPSPYVLPCRIWSFCVKRYIQENHKNCEALELCSLAMGGVADSKIHAPPP